MPPATLVVVDAQPESPACTREASLPHHARAEACVSRSEGLQFARLMANTGPMPFEGAGSDAHALFSFLTNPIGSMFDVDQ